MERKASGVGRRRIRRLHQLRSHGFRAARGLRRGLLGYRHEGGTANFAVGHPEKVIDFAYRAANEMTVKAKAIVAAYYGRAARLALARLLDGREAGADGGATLSAGLRRHRRLERRQSPAVSGILGDAGAQSALHPGGETPHQTISNPYEDNAYAISEGQRLFNPYNCSGCHASSGGGIGPLLIKEDQRDWIYGGEPSNIFDTIVKGRPNGMPTWGGKIPDQSMWHSAGANAANIQKLAILFGLLLGAIFFIVLGVALLSLKRRRRGLQQEPLEGFHRPAERTEARLRTVVSIANVARTIPNGVTPAASKTETSEPAVAGQQPQDGFQTDTARMSQENGNHRYICRAANHSQAREPSVPARC